MTFDIENLKLREYINLINYFRTNNITYELCGVYTPKDKTQECDRAIVTISDPDYNKHRDALTPTITDE